LKGIQNLSDPGSGIRDGKSGSGINIPDPQHCFIGLKRSEIPLRVELLFSFSECLFCVCDRFKLLSQIENFVEHLSAKIVNDQVFPKIESGFLDSEPLIREKTVIAMVRF
jgi:hypothetical protein